MIKRLAAPDAQAQAFLRFSLVAMLTISIALTAMPRSAGAQGSSLATICDLKSGPRAGDRERLRGADALLPVGSPCSDYRGSSGTVVAKDATSGLLTPPDSTRKHSSCYFERGLRAGQILRGVLPAPLGSQCHDRAGNYGVIIEDVPETKKNPPALGGIPENNCRPSRPPGRPPVCRNTTGVP